MGWGAGGGIAASIPITDFLSFNPELSFYYKKLFSMSENEDGYKMEAYANEFAISIPVMLQITPVVSIPFYLAAGAQLDIPFSTETHFEMSYQGQKRSGSEKVDNRSSIDFGIAFGLGYNITSNFGIDLRAVIGLTNLSDNGDVSLNQYGLGVTYFFF